MKRLIAIGLLALFALGCKGIPTPVIRAYYESREPRYIESVQNDDRLTDEQKATLLQAGISFKKLLDEAGD